MKKAKKIFGRIMTVLSVLIFVFGLVVFISVAPEEKEKGGKR